MGLINIYNTIDNKSTVLHANGKLRDILPEVTFKNSLVLKAGKRIDGDYEVTEDDVLYVREVPHAATTIAIVAIATAVVAVGVGVGVAVYADQKSKEAKEEMEKAQRNANNLAAQTQQLPFIRGAKNRSALGENVQFVMGSVYNTPYNLTSGFYSIGGEDGADSYYNAVFSLGYNKQKVTDILIGNESICKRANGIEGELPFDSTSLYYNNDQSRVEVRAPGQALTLANCNQKVNSTYSGAELKHDFGEEAEPVIVQAADNAMKIQVCIQFSSLREYDPNGEVWGTRLATVVPSWSNDGGSTWHTFTFTGSNNNTFIKNANKNIRFVAEKTFTAAESYGKTISIKVEKTTPKKEKNTQEDCCLLWYQTFCYDAQKSTSSSLVACQLVENELYSKTQKVAYRIKANDNTNGILDELHCMTEGLARTWNGSAWSTEKTATRNPASWLLEVLTSGVHLPSQYSDSELDLQSFGALYEYCEDNEFYCDGILTKGEKKKDIIEKILKLCNATLIINNEGLYEVCIDKEEETPVALLNTENIVSFAFSKSLAKKTDGTKVTFTNRDSWSIDTFYSMLDGGSYDYLNDTVDTLAIDYATTHAHAYKIAQRLLRQRQLQPREIKVDVGHEGDYYPLYSTVLLQLPHLLQGLNSSVIKEINYNAQNRITHIQISDLVEFVSGTRYGVIIQATNDYGHRFLQGEVTGTGKTRVLEFATPLDLGNSLIVPELGNHLSFGALDQNGRFTKITATMKIYGIEPNGKDGYSLTLKDYNEDIYSYGGTIPEYKSNITRPQANPKEVTLEDFNNLREQLNTGLESIMIIPDNPGVPDDVTGLTAKAYQDYISISWNAVKSSGLANSVKNYTVEMLKGNNDSWQALTTTENNSIQYNFRRGVDFYPEASVLDNWKFRVKAENVYGKKSEAWTEVFVDTTDYGTWIPATPSFTDKIPSEGGINLSWNNAASSVNGKTLYGSNRFELQVKYDGTLYKTVSTTSRNASYLFDRSRDGYPERTHDANIKGLDLYTFSLKVINESGNEAEVANITLTQQELANYGTWTPHIDATKLITKNAEQEGINFEWQMADGNGSQLYGGVKYTLELLYNGVTRASVNTDSLRAFYVFNRSTDGYPELHDNAENGDTDLSLYTVKVKATSTITNRFTETTAVAVTAEGYKTWKLPAISIQDEVLNRTVILTAIYSSGNVYGNPQLLARIRRRGNFDEVVNGQTFNQYLGITEDIYYHAPEFELSPQPSKESNTELNYCNNDVSQFRSNSNKITQTLPLLGQCPRLFDASNVFIGNFAYEAEDVTEIPVSPEAGDLIHYIGETVTGFEQGKYYRYTAQWEELIAKAVFVPTIYEYELQLTNESGNLSNIVEREITALCTATSDIVHSHEYYKNLYVENLSAINANIGLISQGGMGSFSEWKNFWALSDLSAEDTGVAGGVKKGTFRIGGDNEYFEVIPNPDVDGEYTITLKAGNITLSSTGDGTSFKQGTYIYDANDSSKRMALTPTGIITQQKVNDLWEDVAKVIIDSKGNLILTNADEEHGIQYGFQVENADIYHFESDTLDENGENPQGLTCSGNLKNILPEMNPIIDGKCFEGTVTKNVSSYTGNVVAFSKSNTLFLGTTGRKGIALNGTVSDVENLEPYNAEMRETSTIDSSKTVGGYLGLTAEQVQRGIFY